MNASLETYDKLRHGGFSDEQARALSEAIGEAGQERRLGAIEQRLTTIERCLALNTERLKNLDKRMATGFRFMTWAIGILAALNLAVIAQVFLQ